MPSIKELKGWMTTKQVIKRLEGSKVSRQSILNMAHDGRIRAVQVGGDVWIYDPESVEEMAKKKEKTP